MEDELTECDECGELCEHGHEDDNSNWVCEDCYISEEHRFQDHIESKYYHSERKI